MIFARIFVDNFSQLIPRVFWTLFTVEAIVYAALMVWVVRAPARAWGPEGPVGATVIFIGGPIMLGIPLAAVLISGSNRTMLWAIAMLSWPLAGAIVGPIYSAIQNAQTESRLAGDFNFWRTPQRKLAHALRAHDVAQVRALLPVAGDLNESHGGVSLFEFAMTNIDRSEESRQIIQAMLAAGANPALATPGGRSVLPDAIRAGAAITEMLLEAGADPNRLDGDMPVWWDVLYNSSEEGREILSVLLKHGADLNYQTNGLNPVGRAARLKNWRAAALLIERGVSWKDQLALDSSILFTLNYDLHDRRMQHFEIPEEMEKLKAKFEEDLPH